MPHPAATLPAPHFTLCRSVLKQALAPTRPLRIAILGTRGIPARYGGFETFAERLSVALVERGFEVTVYAEAEPGQGAAEANHLGVKVVSVPVPRWGPASVIGYDLRCLWQARRGFDLVYMLGYGAAFACWLPRVFGTRVWINLDGLEWARTKWSAPVRAYLRVMEWAATRTANRLIADAQAIARRVQRVYPRAAPCTCIAYGAPVVHGLPDAPVLQAYGLAADAYFLVVARIEPENHVDEIVQGHQRYRAQGGTLPLVVVGELNASTRYGRRVASRGSDGVIWAGAVYDPQRLQALRLGARAYLHGHSVGGTNPSLLEALGCGNPVVAHRNEFNAEVLAELGWYFSTPDELAGHLLALEPQAEAQRVQQAEAARARIETRYTWAAIAQSYADLIRSDVGAHGFHAGR